MTSRDLDREQANKDAIQRAFDDWAAGTGGIFSLMTPDARWTIAGSSALSRTYHSHQELMDEVIDPFNARMAVPLVPTVRRLYADGDTVVALFDGTGTAQDGKPYHNTYSWFLRMEEGMVVEVTAILDTIAFMDFWNRITP